MDGDDCPVGERCYPDELYLVDDRNTSPLDDDLFIGVSGCAPTRGSGDSCPDPICIDDEVCVPRPDGSRTAFRGECRRPLGPGLAGAVCEMDRECRSGWCLGVCLTHCRPNGGGQPCVAGTQCTEISLPLWDRGTPDAEDDPMAEVFVCVAP